MSTHCAIIVKDGELYRGICCHNEGYKAGDILFTHYNTPEEALSLVTHLSSINFLKGSIDELEEYVGRNQSPPTSGAKLTDVAWAINHHNNVFVFDGMKWNYNGIPIQKANS
jgi:hypothetical protein